MGDPDDDGAPGGDGDAAGPQTDADSAPGPAAELVRATSEESR
jgi:hypothetical protein